MLINENPLSTCLDALRKRDTSKSMINCFANFVMASGGDAGDLPVDRPNGKSEVKLFGITGFGDTPIEAIRNWMEAASRQTKINDCVIKARSAIRSPHALSDDDTAYHAEILRTHGDANDHAMIQNLSILRKIHAFDQCQPPVPQS